MFRNMVLEVLGYQDVIIEISIPDTCMVLQCKKNTIKENCHSRDYTPLLSTSEWKMTDTGSVYSK